MDLELTEHARIRMQQRAIPSTVLDLLDEYGSHYRCGRAERLMFDREAKSRLNRDLDGKLRDIERYLNVFAVIGDNGHVVTVGRQCRRFRRI